MQVSRTFRWSHAVTGCSSSMNCPRWRPILHRVGSTWLSFIPSCRTAISASHGTLMMFSERFRLAVYGKHVPELWSFTCHTGSQGVTCHQTHVNALYLNPSQTGRCSIYLPWRDGRLSWSRFWLPLSPYILRLHS